MSDRFESTAFKATGESASLKTTIPLVVASVLGLTPGASLVWELDPTTRSARVVRKPAEPEGSSTATESAPKKSKRQA